VTLPFVASVDDFLSQAPKTDEDLFRQSGLVTARSPQLRGVFIEKARSSERGDPSERALGRRDVAESEPADERRSEDREKGSMHYGLS
jgi:hypothetical protein